MRGSSEQGRGRGRMVAAVAAVLLALSGAAAVAVGIAGQDPAPPSPPGGRAALPPPDSEPSSDSTPFPDSDPSPHGEPPSQAAVLGYSEPVHISIPSIGVSSSLVELGLDSRGVMETPQPPHVDQAGWFRPSPPPGIPGATVIAGHVTWNQEPVVFFELGDLRQGDRVRVRRADGIVTVFEVTRIDSFRKDEFPTQAVYNQPDASELRLITCGGEYDQANNRYLDNVIVWAELVDTRKPA